MVLFVLDKLSTYLTTYTYSADVATYIVKMRIDYQYD